jgi:hypothetical protein
MEEKITELSKNLATQKQVQMNQLKNRYKWTNSKTGTNEPTQKQVQMNQSYCILQVKLNHCDLHAFPYSNSQSLRHETLQFVTCNATDMHQDSNEMKKEEILEKNWKTYLKIHEIYLKSKVLYILFLFCFQSFVWELWTSRSKYLI